jgi:predicted aspartyl protease
MATAIIQVAYEAETSSLKNTVNEINQINDKVVQGATDSAKKVKTQFDAIGKSFEAAFSSGQVKKSLDNQTKAIDGLTNSGKSLTGQLRGLKAELSNLEIAGQDGTAAFNELLIAAAKLEDQIGDTRAKVKILASDTFKFDAAVGATQALASGFELAQGAAALFGSESEDLQKAIVKITAATAVANSVQQLSSLITEQSALKTAVLTGAQTAYNVVVGTSTGLLKGFRLALAGTGVGLLVIGLIALIENFDKIKDALSGTSDATRAFEAAQKSANAELAKTKGFLSDAANAQADLNDKLAVSQGKLSAQQAAIDKRTRDAIQATTKDTKALFGERVKLDAVIAGQTKTVEDLQKKQAGFAANEQQSIKTSTANKLAAAQAELNASSKTRAAVVADIAAKTKVNIDAAKTDIAIINSDAKNDAQQKANDKAKELRDAANAKALEATKKAAEDQAKARADLDKLANDAFVASLDEQSKILNESNNKIIELEKTFAAARFKAGSEEEKKALEQQAIVIAEIRAKATADVAALEKTANEKLFKDKLDAAKAAEGATLQQQLAALEEQKTIELSFADKLGLSELEIATRYATAIGKVKTDIAAAAIQDQINVIKTLEIEEGSSLERRIALIRIDAQKRIDAAKGNATEIALINAETEQAITAENQAETEKRIALAEQYAKIVTDSLGSINELSQMASETRIADIEAASEAELEAINNSDELERDKVKQRTALAKRTAAAVAAEKTRQARQDKALAIFEIGVNTAIAISKANTLLPPANIPAIIAAAAVGAAQLAIAIAKPIPKFEKGGLIGGKLHSQGGTMIEAEQGEYMVNRRQTSKHRRELDAMNHSTEAFRKMIDERYVRPALMGYSAGRRGKEGVTVNASLNSKSMEKELRGVRKDLKNRNVIVNINQQDSRYQWQ